VSEPRNALRFGVAFSVGALVGLLIFVAVSTRGTFDLAESVPYTADFYDVQAERLLDGGWDMPRDLLAVEGYAHDGKMFMYFAPGPALLRAPFVAVFGSPDGEWSRAWMIAAGVLALAGLGVLAWQIRRLAGVDATVGVLDMVLAAALALTMSAGSSLLFLLSGPWVYHEALLWAVAATLAAFAALLVWIERPRAWLLAAAGGLSVLAILSRLTVGSAAAIALAMTAAVVAAARVVPPVRDGLARLAGLDHRHVTWRSAAVAAIGSASSFASYAWTNSQKFDSPFGYPLEKYQLFKLVPRRREILVENGGTLLHLDALPTTLVQYFRPDAFALDSGFPWIGAPRWRPDVVGDPRDRTFVDARGDESLREDLGDLVGAAAP
jgi:hypothetical protein